MTTTNYWLTDELIGCRLTLRSALGIREALNIVAATWVLQPITSADNTKSQHNTQLQGWRVGSNRRIVFHLVFPTRKCKLWVALCR